MNATSRREATARAHPNIALAKYWGKRAVAGNVPATPSVSLTLAGLTTRTTVRFDDSLARDRFVLGGVEIEGVARGRVVRLLDEIRRVAGSNSSAHVTSSNDFPTASGLASSASGFAALAIAASAAAGITLDRASISRVARRASASAARSVFGGFVALGTDDDVTARPLGHADGWDVAIVVGAVNEASKEVASTDGMERTRASSPYYDAWTLDAPKLFSEAMSAIERRDLEALGRVAEASALRMHACAIAAEPGLVYWTGATVDLLAVVRGLRARGLGAWATIDAGPHVKVLCARSDANAIAAAVAPLCARTIIATPGPGAHVVESPS